MNTKTIKADLENRSSSLTVDLSTLEYCRNNFRFALLEYTQSYS